MIASKTVGNKTADKCEVFKKMLFPIIWNEFIDFPSACAWNYRWINMFATITLTMENLAGIAAMPYSNSL